MRKVLIFYYLLLFSIRSFSQVFEDTPAKEFLFDDNTIPLSHEWFFGFDYWSYPISCPYGTLVTPFLVGNSFTGFNGDSTAMNKNIYYKTVGGAHCLRIKAEKYPNKPHTCMRGSLPYRSALLFSKDTFGYGKYDVRCKIPHGRGLWPAVWLWRGDYEIDIMETINVNSQSSDNPWFSMHSGYCSNPVNPGFQGGYGMLNYPEDLANDFHVYSVEWTEGQIIWKIDEKTQWVVSADKTEGFIPPPLNMIINLSVNNDPSKPPIDDNALPAYLDIDYIKYYIPLSCKRQYICQDDNPDYYAAYELYFAIGDDINNDGVKDITWSCNPPGYDFSCEKKITGHVKAEAENFILLNPGFTAEYGSDFTAEIKPCSKNNANKNGSYLKPNLFNPSPYTQNIKVSPNPGCGIYKIDINNRIDISYLSIEMFNIYGQKIFVHVCSTLSDCSIDISQQPKGIYIMILSDINKSVIHIEKIVNE